MVYIAFPVPEPRNVGGGWRSAEVAASDPQERQVQIPF